MHAVKNDTQVYYLQLPFPLRIQRTSYFKRDMRLPENRKASQNPEKTQIMTTLTVKAINNIINFIYSSNLNAGLLFT